MRTCELCGHDVEKAPFLAAFRHAHVRIIIGVLKRSTAEFLAPQLIGPS